MFMPCLHVQFDGVFLWVALPVCLSVCTVSAQLDVVQILNSFCGTDFGSNDRDPG